MKMLTRYFLFGKKGLFLPRKLLGLLAFWKLFQSNRKKGRRRR